MTKKILIMTQNFYPVIGSAGNRMKNTYKLLNEHHIQADVLTTEPAYPNKNLYHDSAFWDDASLNSTKKIMRVPIRSKKFTNQIFNRLLFYVEIMYRFFKKLWKLRKEGYDYILVSTPPIFIVFSVFLAKPFMRTKLILEVRDLWPDSLIGVKKFDNRFIIKLFRFLERRMYAMADHIIINSKGFNDHITTRLKKKKPNIIYLPNGPRDYEVVKTKSPITEFRVVYTGNIGLAQDVERLKKMAYLLSKEGIRLDVIGYGMKTEEFANYIQNENLENVHLSHPTTRKKSLELIERSNLAIAFLNNDDVFHTVLPGKIIDYMACQTPVIAGIQGTAAKVITENRAGYVFTYKDVHKMVDKIVELKANPKELDVLRANCLKTIEKEFLWETNIERLVQLLS